MRLSYLIKLIIPVMLYNMDFAVASDNQQDWAQLNKYASANLALIKSSKTPDLVMMGDSITEFWLYKSPDFFGEGRVDRGISGQTTSQMLERFNQDVLALHPKVVHIMGGTNDIAGNSGSYNADLTKENIKKMALQAKDQGAKVMLGAVPPAQFFYWNPKMGSPMPLIRELNKWLEQFAMDEGLIFVDHFSVLYNNKNGMSAKYCNAEEPDDVVHPNALAYKDMEKILLPALAKALSK